MSFLFRKVEDVTTISKSLSLTSVSIKDCTLRVPNTTTTLFFLRAIIKAIFTSNPRWKTLHTLDDWFLRRADLNRVVNARIHAGMSLHSDHHPIMLELRIAANLGKHNGSAAPGRPQTYLLTDPETRRQFRSVTGISLQYIVGGSSCCLGIGFPL